MSSHPRAGLERRGWALDVLLTPTGVPAGPSSPETRPTVQ